MGKRGSAKGLISFRISSFANHCPILIIHLQIACCKQTLYLLYVSTWNQKHTKPTTFHSYPIEDLIENEEIAVNYDMLCNNAVR